MKKLIISLLAMVMLSVSSAYAEITDTAQSGAFVVVKGNIEKEKAGVFVTLVVAKQGVTDENIISSFDSSVSYIDQTQTDENGGYTFRIYLPDSFDSNSIYIRSGEGKYRVAKKESVSYTAVSLVKSAIKGINNAYYDNADDAQRIQAMLTALSSEHLMLHKLDEYAEYSVLENPSSVAKYMLDVVKGEKLKYDSDEALSNSVEKVIASWKEAVGISAVNESENQTEMKAVFNKYSDVFGIDPERLNGITKGEYFCEQIKRFAPSTIAGLKKAYNASCAFSDANNTISWSVLKNVFTADYEYLGVDMSDSGSYAKISDKDAFFKKLSDSVPFADLDSLVSTFNILASGFNPAKPTPAPTYGGGGGGGSSSGGGSGKPLTGAIAPSNPGVVGSESNTAVTKKTFNDITQTEWARESIEYLVAKNIVNGVSDTSFEPQRNVTRAEFLKMVILAFGIQSGENSEEFNDVNSADWFYEYAMSGKDAGIINGDENGNFNPGVNISRQDMAVMLYRCMKNIETADNAVSFGDSKDIKDYAFDAINALSTEGIINGYEDNTFRPFANATRAEATKMIYNAIKGN